MCLDLQRATVSHPELLKTKARPGVINCMPNLRMKGKLWRNLRKEQDEEFHKCLELDRKKQAALEGEIEELSKLEELRSIKAARVPAVWM